MDWTDNTCCFLELNYNVLDSWGPPLLIKIQVSVLPNAQGLLRG